MSILGVYKRDAFNSEIRVGTPDPNKYHDIGAQNLETRGGSSMAGMMPGNHGFNGLRGTIIPRSTNLGGSRGFDHMTPMKAYIDPELTNRQIVVDMAKVGDNPQLFAQSIDRAFRKGYTDPSDAMVESFAAFMEPIEGKSIGSEITLSEPQQKVAQEISPHNTPTGTYVAPRATTGGAQVQSNFTVSRQIKPQPGFGGTRIYTPQQQQDLHVEPVVPMVTVPVKQKISTVKSLQSEFSETPKPVHKKMATPVFRKVIFELPIPGQPDANSGYVSVLYHDIIESEDVLVLVYDHNQPMQSLYWPPKLEDPITKLPVPMNLVVQGASGQPNMLYQTYPSGVQFVNSRNEEYCILVVEKRQQYNQPV